MDNVLSVEVTETVEQVCHHRLGAHGIDRAPCGFPPHALFQRSARHERQHQPHLLVVGNDATDERQDVAMRRNLSQHIVLFQLRLCIRGMGLLDDHEPTFKNGLEHLAEITTGDLYGVCDVFKTNQPRGLVGSMAD